MLTALQAHGIAKEARFVKKRVAEEISRLAPLIQLQAECEQFSLSYEVLRKGHFRLESEIFFRLKFVQELFSLGYEVAGDPTAVEKFSISWHRAL